MQNRDSMATKQLKAENVQAENTDGLASKSLRINIQKPSMYEAGPEEF